MFKASGCVLIIAIICWAIYLWLTDIKLLNKYKHIFIGIFLTVFIGLLFFCILIFFLKNGDLLSYWKIYFSVGSYSTEFTKSSMLFFASVINFMLRHTSSLSNLTLFSLTFIFLIWGLVRNHFIKTTSLHLKLLCPLLSIWGIGSIGAVISPGSYAPYYYILIWPSIAIFLVLGIRDIFHYSGFVNKKIFILIMSLISGLFFAQRVYTITPTYIKLFKENINLSCFLQRESFQDPIKSTNQRVTNSKRPYFLKLADSINSYVPNKLDTIYIVNFSNEFSFLRTDFYLYIKRFPPTTVVNDYLHYRQYLYKRINVLISNLSDSPPKLVILPQIFYLQNKQDPSLKPFFVWLSQFLKQNYHLEHILSFTIPGSNENQAFLLFEKN